MNILEIKAKKEELEIKIKNLLLEFEEQTSLKVKDLEIENVEIIGYSGNVIGQRNVIAKIEI